VPTCAGVVNETVPMCSTTGTGAAVAVDGVPSTNVPTVVIAETAAVNDLFNVGPSRLGCR
jgi:hypothetical protein